MLKTIKRPICKDIYIYIMDYGQFTQIETVFLPPVPSFAGGGLPRSTTLRSGRLRPLPGSRTWLVQGSAGGSYDDLRCAIKAKGRQLELPIEFPNKMGYKHMQKQLERFFWCCKVGLWHGTAKNCSR